MTNKPFPPLLLGSRFLAAVSYANDLHRNDLRKGTNIPYMTHLMSVASLVIGLHGHAPDPISEDAVIAALLHDSAEDHGPSALEEVRGRFGVDVATVVAECSDSIS